ncbi:23S rRNA (adenine(1618)-N(6))-methyltransferase RlmF [Oceaniserpentilla sp. 4NH20-0058]|uniref:23S rRNA (adenine(1618)-N(6))-methyltransferase RlmF n=1 Tax=Oceaniserpentilla sp. 4NH20-0058 TaxID=3127660 RepID=UPI003108E406
MHSRNPHQNGYDMDALTRVLPELTPFIIKAKHDRLTIDFSNDKAVKLLNKALLMLHYGLLDWDIPAGYLCPPIPGRLDYLCFLDEFLQSHLSSEISQHKGITGLDIGTGANLIYPLLASRHLHWNMVASDIDSGAIKSAEDNIQRNLSLNLNIQVRKQPDSNKVFENIIMPGEYYHVTLCNPPFHESRAAAMAGSERKNTNLNRNKQKRQSNLKKIEQTKTLNFQGKGNELWCQGGEKRFIADMICESKMFQQQVGWFTCLVSKKETIAHIKRLLNKLNGQFKEVPMKQGNKISRFIAWRF